MDIGGLEERIEQLVHERDTFIEQAQQRVAALNGAIAELERLIAELTQNDEERDDS